MSTRILCVAEKPSIAKAVANHLAGNNVRTNHIAGNQYIKNYTFQYTFPPPWGPFDVVFTSVAGHIMESDFEPEYRGWQSCPPQALFDARIVTSVGNDKKPIAKNIETQARWARALFIWTDCDREGEHIGSEIRDIARKAKADLEVKRARFSNIERAHVIQAARNPIDLDEKQANAVAARIELDLRIGAAFTRMQTLNLQHFLLQVGEEKKVISYGSCQFPTLGFVVDRYFRVKNFVPEPFWSIRVVHDKDGHKVAFNWARVRLFDRMAVTIIYERCLDKRTARITEVKTKPASKWRPLPLTTVELQKMGSRFLRMDSQRVMKIAEDLYTKGFISYPRTETDQFDQGMNLRGIVEKQVQDGQWGPFAQNLMNGGFRWPRSGKQNDKAHPPIHPIIYVARNALGADEYRVYEFIVRRFLACCSEDAKGEQSIVTLQYGSETFSATGLVVLQRNYLDVYPYDKWESSQPLPKFTVGETFVPTEAKMNEGKTTAPGYLTEPELIALMDANGIGTDATMAEHIAKIKERQYVMTRPTSGGARSVDGDDAEDAPAARGGRGRGGRGRGRGGRESAATGRGNGSTTGVQEFIPTTLGVALVEGYDNLSFETSLAKPFLRKEMELQMRAICAGTTSKGDVVQQNLERYRDVYARTAQQMNVLKAAFTKYVLNNGAG